MLTTVHVTYRGQPYRGHFAIFQKIVSEPIGDMRNSGQSNIILFLRSKKVSDLTLFLNLLLVSNLWDDLYNVLAFCFTLAVQVKFLHFLLQQKLFLGILVFQLSVKVETFGQSRFLPSFRYSLRLSRIYAFHKLFDSNPALRILVQR